MIFNMNGNSESPDMTAEKVKYGDGNVDQALGTLEDELTANGKRIYLDYKDGKYGYNIDPLRGADTFSPFRSGGSSESEFTNLTTVASITGDKLPTIINGSGYITIKRISYTSNTVDQLNVYIDDNTEPFRISSTITSGLQGGFYTLFFQKSIRFENGSKTDTYFYQTLLADELIAEKYKIIHSTTYMTNYITITGKGKILISTYNNSPTIRYSVDNLSEQSFPFNSNQCMEFIFNESFTFKSLNEYFQLYYIAYTEI